MGRSPCCHGEAGVKKGPWTPEEDKLLVDYIQEKGHGSWHRLPKLAGLNRCGKSCRLRWTNYLRPDIKRGRFTDDEGKLIINLHSLLGSKWSSIAKKLPGRTDNEIKNFWNTHLRKKLLGMGIDPVTHRPRTDLSLLDGLFAADGSWNFQLLPRSSPNSLSAMDFADLDEREGDYTSRLVNSSWKERINKLLMESAKISACHEYNRLCQPLPVISTVPLGGLGKRALVRHVYRDFDSDRMFQNTDSKTLLRSIVNRASEQPLNVSVASYQSIKRKIKDTLDFVLGIDKQKAIRKKGIDMDILWCIVDALAEECNHAKFSHGPNIRPTFSSMLCAKTRSRYMHTRTGTKGVNFSGKGADASVRILWHHRIPEADASFCSPPWVFDSGASFCWMGCWNPLVGLHQVDPVSVANGRGILALSKHVLLVGDSIKTDMKNTRPRRLRKSRNNKGRRVVTRRSLAQNTRHHKRGDTRALSQKNRGLVSRSEPISADNSSLLTPDSTPERAWRVASAAPQHMTGYLKHLTDYTPASGDQFIDTPSMGRMPFHGRGSVNTTNMTLRDVLYVPGLETSLVSTGQLAEFGYTIAIGPYGCRVYKDDEGMDLVGKAHYVDGYLLELDFLRV